MKVHQSTVLGGYSLELNGTHRIVKVFRDEKTGKKSTMRLWGDLKHIPMEERRKIQLNPAEAPDQDCDGDDSDTEEELEREQVAESVRVRQVSKKRKTPELAQPRRALKRQKNSASSTGRLRKSGQVTAPCEPPAPDTVDEAPRFIAYPGGPRSRVVNAAIEEVAEEDNVIQDDDTEDDDDANDDDFEYSPRHRARSVSVGLDSLVDGLERARVEA